MEETSRRLRRRLWILAGICLLLAASSKLLYLRGFTLPNLELIIPVLVVTGSTYLWRVDGRAERVGRAFGLLVLGGVLAVDLLCWGWHPIYLFTWSGFLLVWLLATGNRVSPFSGFWPLLGRTALTGAAAILLFDLWTGVVGSPLTCPSFYGPLTSLHTWLTALALQFPFTLYHLSSLLFFPPLVGLLRLSTRIRVEAPLAIRVGASLSTTQRG